MNKQKIHSLVAFLVTFCASLLIGIPVGIHVSGQNFDKYVQKQDSAQIIKVTTQIELMDTQLNSLSNKFDALKSEADTTQAMGAGIGIAITFLQLLGFIASRRRTD